jgi:hypothetical protein
VDFGAILSAILPRVIGIGAAWITQKTAEKTGIVVDPASLNVAALAAYALVHRAVSSKLNPGDAAKPRMVEADKAAVATGSAVIPAPPTK